MSFAPAAACGPLRLKGEVSHSRKVKFLGLAFSLPLPLFLPTPARLPRSFFFSISPLCCPGSAPTRWKVRKVNSRFTASLPWKGESNGVGKGVNEAAQRWWRRQKRRWGEVESRGRSTFLRKFIQIKVRRTTSWTAAKIESVATRRARIIGDGESQRRLWKPAPTVTLFHRRSFVRRLNFRSRRTAAKSFLPRLHRQVVLESGEKINRN